MLDFRDDELIVDNFAGGGGASVGIQMALGRDVDIAINHDPQALAMHAINHPNAQHLCENVWDVDIEKVIAGRPVGLAWFSPDCKHFSKAKGGKPVEKKIRGLAWVALKWAGAVRPRVIFLENVEEFQTWGPVVDGKPCKRRKGMTFKRWVTQLRNLGYVVEWREMKACDYGAPTIRKRLFVIARRDGLPIVWPEPTHAAGGDLFTQPYRTAAECIDWSLPCASIFLSREEGRAVGVNRPLADATMRRIARGIKRYVLDAAKPFIVPIAHYNGSVTTHSIDNPLNTVTANPKGGSMALVTPMLTNLTHQGSDRNESVEEPFRTVTGAKRGEKALVSAFLNRVAHGERDKKGKKRGKGEHSVEEALPTVLGTQEFALVSPILAGVGGRMGQSAERTADAPMQTITAKGDTALVIPTLIQTGYGEREGQQPRVPGLDKPLGTPVAGGVKHALVAAHITRFNQNGVGLSPEEPMDTVMAGAPRFGVTTAFLERQFSGSAGNSVEAPVGTTTAGGGGKTALVAAHLSKYYGEKRDGEVRGSMPDEPLATQPTENRHAVVTAFLAQHNAGPNNDNLSGRAAEEPLSTIATTGSQQQVVASHLVKLRGTNVGSPTDEPVHTVSAGGTHIGEVRAFLLKYYGTDQDPKLTEPLPTATTKDRFAVVMVTIAGDDYVIVDIGMRMLTPRELFLAQGFPPAYTIDRGLFADGTIRPLTKTAQVRMCGNSVSPYPAAALIRAQFDGENRQEQAA